MAGLWGGLKQTLVEGEGQGGGPAGLPSPLLSWFWPLSGFVLPLVSLGCWCTV